MGFRVVSSRQRFREYLSELQRRMASRKSSTEEEVPGRRRRVRTTRQLLKAFYDLTSGQRFSIAVALATLTVSTVLALAPPAATKFLVDYVLTDRPLPDTPFFQWLPTDRWNLLLVITLAVTLLSIVRIGIHISGRWQATRVTKRMQLSVRRRVFEHAVRLPLHRVQELKSGGVSSILREDAGSVGELIFGLLYNPWRALIQLIGSLCVLAWVDWRLLSGALLLFPLVFVTQRTWIRRIRPQYKEVRAQRVKIDSHATEAFGGMRVVRAFGRHHSEAGRFMRGNHLMGRQELHVWWWARVVEMVWETLIPLGSGALLLYGGWQVVTGALTLGDLMMFLAYLLMLLEPLAVLAESATQFQNSLSALDRVLDLLDEPTEMPRTTDSLAVRAHSVAGRITFENVSFTYPGGVKPALRNVSIDVEPGRMIALVGHSGSGKTTLCNLVARFYDPTSGRILLDGRDLRDIDVESYRGILGVVEQDVFLFDGTVAENIAYANRHAEPEEVVRAAEIANAAEFIDALPEGYETLIGERGVKLSGGQRQRIAIARAVLANPRILILDEATSNLDTESERLIQNSLAALMRDRTSFVIAHRLSTIAHADKILVLEKGEVLESGTHAELMESDGRYREMVLLQTQMQREITEASLAP
ncbi:MAG: ABC transporter ATP-binding protein [Planctomycetaceae bacterium]